MPDILARICRAKRDEIDALARVGRSALLARAARQPAPRAFRKALCDAPGTALIAEVKKASPSVGVIRADFDPARMARDYERGGAAALSVLTDRPFFQGSPDFVEHVRQATALPVLRKDFLLDPLQVIEARGLGADACLLIVAALEAAALRDLMALARDLHMDALVEAHDGHELDVALDAGADLVGVNNRNLRTFEVTLETAERLAGRVPDGVVLVAESGIRTPADVERLRACGVKAILVGETLMRAADPGAAARALMGGPA
ncbi:MAG: indole-3-glycerol phosphate synthase TrpC [Candidatus Brocadiaceae bacterium]|nr:indole-3-glycerol phosphate synthase TrpC [Candidatus Brocadiaceae bacterium]